MSDHDSTAVQRLTAENQLLREQRAKAETEETKILDAVFPWVPEARDENGSQLSAAQKVQRLASYCATVMQESTRLKGLLQAIRSRPCPRDTNGDGDCGMPLCPYCGTAIREAPKDAATGAGPQQQKHEVTVDYRGNRTKVVYRETEDKGTQRGTDDRGRQSGVGCHKLKEQS